MAQPPAQPKIYHIVHVDRLASIVADGFLSCDAAMAKRANAGTTIGMSIIKERRLTLEIKCHPGLHVGECVPFYFCPRSVMLFLIDCANHPDLAYLGGQEPIIHLEADLRAAVDWARQKGKRWAFTLSNAGARYFEERCDLGQLHEINWDAVGATKWSGPGISTLIKEGKQAEFLLEGRFPWSLVERIGVLSHGIAQQAASIMSRAAHRPRIEIKVDWYY
jgi:ssDNA thymidine ADP-ribosyltransferase, DarT